MVNELPSDKIYGTKNALFLFSRAPTHHSFTFNLRFLHELKQKVRFRFVFIKVCFFVHENAWTL